MLAYAYDEGLTTRQARRSASGLERLDMFTLQQLKDLDAVVTHGGFRAAARALDVSQAGLTKSIARLEAEYRLTLMERQSSGLCLTAQGKDFLRQARMVIANAERADQCLLDFAAKPRLSARLGVSIEPSLSYVPTVLADFHRRCPHVSVHMTHGVAADLFDALREGRVEAVVSRIPEGQEDNGLVVDDLYTSDMAIVARGGHPKARAASMHELVDCDWLVVGDPSRDFQQDASITELFLARGLTPPRSASISQSLFSAVAILVNSDHVARLPRSILRHPLTRNLLCELPVGDLDSSFTVGLARKRNLQPSAELQTLIAMLASYARVTRISGAPELAIAA